MKSCSIRFVGVWAVACLLAPWAGPASAYIDILPPTLGDLCRQSTDIRILRIEKVSAEKGVIRFKAAEALKAKPELPAPDGALTKQLIQLNVPGARTVLDAVAEGKPAILFAKDLGSKAVAHVYLEGHWYLLGFQINGSCWVAAHGEPDMLTRYCGTADQLGHAVAKMLR